MQKTERWNWLKTANVASVIAPLMGISLILNSFSFVLILPGSNPGSH